jgi:hypothetical protein
MDPAVVGVNAGLKLPSSRRFQIPQWSYSLESVLLMRVIHHGKASTSKDWGVLWNSQTRSLNW